MNPMITVKAVSIAFTVAASLLSPIAATSLSPRHADTNKAAIMHAPAVTPDSLQRTLVPAGDRQPNTGKTLTRTVG